MRRSHKVLLLMALWLTAEFAVFSLIVSAIGWSGAIALGMLTSIAGFVMIRDIGRRVMGTLSSGMRSGTIGSGPMLEGSLQGAGAVLLILPGFLSDIIGLVLAAPSLRRAILRRFGSTRSVASDGTLDLERGEWRSADGDSPATRLEGSNSAR